MKKKMFLLILHLFSASEDTESEYESANEHSFDDVSFNSPQKDFIDIKQVKVNENSNALGVDSITDVLAGMKIYSTGKKIEKENNSIALAGEFFLYIKSLSKNFVKLNFTTLNRPFS